MFVIVEGDVTLRSAGVELGVEDGQGSTAGQRGFVGVGWDGTNFQFIKVNVSGEQAVTVASLPLPAGAATEATLATLLTESTFTARIPVLGQKAMAGSIPVVIASNQSSFPVTQDGAPWVVDLFDERDYDTGAGTDFIGIVGIALPNAGGAVAGGTSANPVRIDPTGTTAQPISATSLPLPSGAATEATLATRATEATVATLATQATLASIKDTDGVKKITDPLPAGTNEIGKVAQGTPAAATAPWAYRASDGSAFINVSLEHITAASPHAARLSDGAAFYDAVKTGQLPAALVGGRVDANIGAWLGSTAPTVGQKTAVASVPVIIASDQSAIPVTTGGGNPTTVVVDTLKDAGSDNMVVDGSGTPVEFLFGADPTNDILITALRFVVTVGGLSFDGANFGKGGGSLTNGLLIEATVNGGTTITLANIQRNEGFLRLQGSAFTELGGANDVLVASVEFAGRVLLEAGTGDQVKVTVRDNLTGGARDFKYLTCTFFGVKE